MGNRAHDLDFNPGGTQTIDGDTDITKFGFDYSTTEDLFATLIRIRNTNCEGFSPCNFTVPPFDTQTIATYRIADGSSKVPSVGQLQVRDNSILSYRSGTIASNLIESLDIGFVFIGHDFTSGLPLFDGVEVAAGLQNTTPGRRHSIQIVSLDTGETINLQFLSVNGGRMSIAAAP